MNSIKTLLTPALVAGVMALGCLAAAQGHQGRGMGRGFGGGFGNNPTFLLRRTDVQSDLQLTADQKSKLDDLMTSMRGQRGSGGGFGNGGNGGNGGTPPTDAERQQMRAQMEQRRAEMEKSVDAILSPEQQQRLDEISIQVRGNTAILDSKVQDKLDMTSDQKAKISDLQQKERDAMQSVFQKMQDNSITSDQARASFQKNNDVMKDELGKILTHSQSEKLKHLGGAPFKADPSESEGGFGGGFGGGRHRGGGGGGAGGF